MDTIELFERLGLSLAIGLLIGLERGWRGRDGEAGSRVAGFRTFGLIGLLGGVGGALVPVSDGWPLALLGLGFAAVFGAFQYRWSVAEKDFSVTSFVVGLLVYALGAYAVLGDRTVAVSGGIAVLAVLAARPALHGFLRRITWPELRAAVILLAMTFLFLPLLPDRTVDPWDALNPHKLWLMVVLIAAVSFLGYAAVRVLGEREGLLAAAAAGALVSSTAVTLNNARLAAKSKNSAPLAAGVAIAWVVSLLRMTAIACVIETALILPLAGPIGATALVFVLGAGWLITRGKSEGTAGAILKTPFQLSEVFGFGALVVAVILASKWLNDAFGQAGLLPLAAISGAVDVDPITLSAANLASSPDMAPLAATAILIAGASNIVLKTAVAIFVGGMSFGLVLGAVSLAGLAAGAAAYVLL